MSNSNLVVYKKLSPNCSKPRNHKIDTITIHCMAGNLTVESCGNVFANSKAGASSNYGIGSDGRIGLYVDEANRSWATSSPSNDHRAVTIEVANNGGAPDWPVSDAALNSLIKLCADICKRNNISRLLWKGDKSLIGKVDKQNMTVHRWFAQKACPGNYLYNLHGKIASEVNKLLASNNTNATKNNTTVNKSNDEIAYEFFQSKGLSIFGIAGIMGNLYAESNLKSNILQNSFQKKLNMSSDKYTKSVDDGTYKNFTTDSAGYGIAQWTNSSRKKALLDYSKKQKTSIGDIRMQLSFLWTELYPLPIAKGIKEAKSVKEASDIFLTQFEKPSDQSNAVKNKRIELGEMYYKKFTSKKNEFIVKITTSSLNYRSGPGTDYPVLGTINDKGGKYTIVETSKGKGSTSWGKLKSGKGWISMDYTLKC